MTGANRTGGPPVGSWSGFRCGRGSVVSSKYLQSEELDVISTGGRLGSVTWLLPANRRCSWADSWVTLCVCPEQRWAGRRRGGVWASVTLWLGTWSSLSLQHTGVTGSVASLYTVSLCYYPLPPSPSTTHLLTHTQFFLTVIHAAHPPCFQERQIKSGLSYRSVTLELWASWIKINSIKRHSLCFTASSASTLKACPCRRKTYVFIYTITHKT